MSVSENLKFLENYLAERTYIQGNRPSQADILVLNTLRSAPTKATTNVYRWYTHIQSFNDEEKKNFPEKSLINEVTKLLNKLAITTVGDDYNDVDPSGLDNEVTEAERNAEGRLKSDSVEDQNKPAVIAKLKSSVYLISFSLEGDFSVTDAPAVESYIRSIEMPGFTWGDAKLVPVGYEFQFTCVIDNDYAELDDFFFDFSRRYFKKDRRNRFIGRVSLQPCDNV